MEKISVKGLEFSRLQLGTVQLGVPYGINNAGGQPDREEAFKILDCAIEKGINILDTASGYGESEEIIGEWLKTIPQEKRPTIVTKMMDLDHSSYDALKADVFAKVEESRRKLGVETIDVLMLHRFDDYTNDRENMMKVFQALKDEGLIKYAGASVYSYHNWKELAESGFDATQIPMNIFDWTQITNGGLSELEKSGMMVFVRSVYLQGLIFRNPDDLPAHMDYCVEPLKKFHGLCEKYKLTPAELAMSFVLSLKGIHGLVLGSEKVEQVEQNVELFENTVRFGDAEMEEIRGLFEVMDPRVINPSEWEKE
ncbi:MAG: aldo/keto reductase [Clostridia bacterium]|nr:aldo/keto reductase [Clostridia bacterium]MBQ6895012.1 aldo/keto reductase [Clostridia bacterium]